MIETFAHGFQDFARNVRIVDFFDVAFVTVFLYILLNWLIKSTSRRSLFGISILIGIYVLARATGMYLTELLVRLLFVFILIGIVIVFQSDIRRMIDRIGNWKIFGKKSPHESNIISDVITEAATKMAENRTGALIVLKGKEEWERHINGGIPLDGKISIPLLHSIFNTKAPGHDGAVLLEGNQILRFGTHLPLSTNLGKKSAGGTRHAAALGLCELCDALVIVVSEERGIISIGRGGRLTELESASELKKTINDYWDEYYQPKETSPLDWWRKRNLRIGFASVVLAILLWLGLAYEWGTVLRTYAVPIEYRNLKSSNIALRDSLPLEARVTLSGSDQAFRTLDPAQLIVSFNMASKNLNTSQLLITKKNITLPTGISLNDVSPKFLDIKPGSVQKKKIRIPIKVSTKGKLKEGLTLAGIRPQSSYGSFLADSTGSNIPDTIYTEPVDLSTISASDTLTQKLHLIKGIELATGSKENISVIIDVRDK